MNIFKFLKFAVLFILFLIIFYLFEYGFNFDAWDKLIRPFLLSVLTVLIFLKPALKVKMLFLVGFCFALMILADLVYQPIFAQTLGGFGFSLLVVTIFFYLPQIIKKGHVEKF